MSDFVDIIASLTSFVQSERRVTFGEGMDEATKSIKKFMRDQLGIDTSPNAAIPDLLFRIKEHFETTHEIRIATPKGTIFTDN